MHLTEIHDGIPTAAALRESTRIQRHGGKNGNQQYIDRGFGKAKMSIMNRFIIWMYSKNGCPSTSAFGASQSGAPFSYIILLISFFSRRIIFFSSLEI